MRAQGFYWVSATVFLRPKDVGLVGVRTTILLHLEQGKEALWNVDSLVFGFSHALFQINERLL